ncbi:VOC family protein [Thermogemmatispora carboxidivorans]|uniref:VOC family protein n=1 Tax=Thermogemmatispora carboxidivorans TaxID=1382306 RepID=UPI000699EFB2|nr:VOC family protein [Thermogemmatispora carboxidivorans]
MSRQQKPPSLAALTAAGARWFQVAYAVNDLAEAQRFFQETLGVPRFFVIEDIQFRAYTYRGQPAYCRQHVAFGYAGPLQIELMQPLEGENSLTAFLRQRGPGVHHLGLEVDDLEQVLGALQGASAPEGTEKVTIIESGIAGQGTRFAFLDTLASSGTYLELVTLDEENRALFERIRRGDF